MTVWFATLNLFDVDEETFVYDMDEEYDDYYDEDDVYYDSYCDLDYFDSYYDDTDCDYYDADDPDHSYGSDEYDHEDDDYDIDTYYDDYPCDYYSSQESSNASAAEAYDDACVPMQTTDTQCSRTSTTTSDQRTLIQSTVVTADEQRPLEYFFYLLTLDQEPQDASE